MLKNNKFTLIVTSIVILIPVIAGILLWNKLPDQIATHWGVNGNADGWHSKHFAVFFIPVLILLLHWLCVLGTTFSKKADNIQGTLLVIVLWICPVVSLLCGSAMYFAALGYDINIEIISPILAGILFVVIGNYLPKVKRNYVLGIKLPWTVKSDENWYHTHRMSGVLWVIGGIVSIISGFLKSFIIFIVIIFLMIIVPTIYSYVYYHKNEK